MTDLHPAITRIRSALKQESFTSGTCRVPLEHCELYYKSTSDDAKFLNLAKATDEQLAQLISACDAAPFGRGTETVLDESYRKALKLDLSQFSMPFELANTDILQKIQQDLVETDTSLRRRIRAEPYKLNIYDKGAFFKAHQDTPRAESMFGSLVVIFPTPHEGGNFILSSEDEQWSFDGPKMLAASTPAAPEVAYIAFYSDTTHEVLPVISGCRVTLTYNLYFETAANASGMASATNEKYDVVRRALQEIVDDNDTFPAKGILCFGLAHQYSIARRGANKTAFDLSELAQFLKGSDALIYSVCKDLGLEVALKAFYTNVQDDYEVDSNGKYSYLRIKEYYVASDFIPDHSYQVEERRELYRGLKKIGTSKETKSRLVWVTAKSTFNRVGSSYLAYGNDASLEHTYGDVCLVVQRRSRK